ncbi:alpha/beta hydrolase [Luteibacter yeojuensis]|uniref:Alpha/beta hydrolase n=1 Tax=Luteibacter yeojuensis TaxID=345309 RepID=A0A7X5QVU4_9GAMM|nr:alpha/beta fold hydrolase [Luteibacter yeojuensis]NID16372.1 alpha/beta hydrolase [Luteibacter yeojuensis]
MAMLMIGAMASAALGAMLIETTNIPLPGGGEHVALHCVAPRGDTGKAVLFVHGSTFPTKLAFGFQFRPGDSWMHYMARQGYLACGLDFLGYGGSSMPAAMKGDASAAPPVDRAPEAAEQIAAAVSYMHGKKGVMDVHIVAHSWGTIPAAAYAARYPHELASLTLFGPIVPKPGAGGNKAPNVAWFPLTAGQRLEQLRFEKVLPAGKVLLEPAVSERWAREFRASTPTVGDDAPERMRIPNGSNVDIAEGVAGTYPYAAADVSAPVFVVFGNYDTVVNDAEASAFLGKFTSSPMKWRLCIDDGTHVMHLERQRWSLYESVAAFIRATSEAGR